MQRKPHIGFLLVAAIVPLVVAGGCDKLRKLDIRHREAVDGEGRYIDFPHRAFAVIRKAVRIVGSH